MCTVAGCEASSVLARGMCSKHYQRWRRHGRPAEKRQGGRWQGHRFLRDVVLGRDFGSDCLVWPFSTSKGYALVWIGGARHRVHRIVCEATHGPAPSSDYEVAHSCGNRSCVNGRHLRWATHEDNMADAIGHGTTPRGERNGQSKLTEEKVRAVRNLKNRASAAEVARQFDVSRRTVRRLWNGQSWGWLP